MADAGIDATRDAPPDAKPCIFADDFSGTTIRSAYWEVFDSPQLPVRQNEALTFELPNGGPSVTTMVRSVVGVDRANPVTVRLATPPSAATSSTSFELLDGNNQSVYRMAVSRSSVDIRLMLNIRNSTANKNMLFDSAQHVILGIHHANDEVVFTARDVPSAAPTELLRAVSENTLGKFKILIQATANGTIAPSTVTWDDFNVTCN